MSKYSLFKEKFQTDRKPEYVGKILINSLSERITNNTRMTEFLINVENIIQEWLNSVGYIRKQVNYRVDTDDHNTIK